MKAHAAHPGYSATNLQGKHRQPDRHEVFQVGNRLVATDADFGARQTLYAVSQDLPGDSFIGPRFAHARPHRADRSRSPLARDAKKAAALWDAVRAAHGHQIRALIWIRCPDVALTWLGRHGEGGFDATVIDGNHASRWLRPWPCTNQ